MLDLDTIFDPDKVAQRVAARYRCTPVTEPEASSSPRIYWQARAKDLLSNIHDRRLVDDLWFSFQEREAIAAIDGHQDDDMAGRLAFDQLKSEIDRLGSQKGI